jgi:hypothetical protein
VEKLAGSAQPLVRLELGKLLATLPHKGIVMSLTKIEKVDQIEITENGVVQVRTRTIVMEDDKEISNSLHRHLIVPGQSYENETEKVRSVCAAVHTQEIIDAFEAEQEAAKVEV